MPAYAPRTEPVKKKEQLIKAITELKRVVYNNSSIEKQKKAAEKYRSAQLTFLKAKLHVIQEKEFENKPFKSNLKKLEKEILLWTNKDSKEIIHEIKFLKNY